MKKIKSGSFSAVSKPNFEREAKSRVIEKKPPKAAIKPNFASKYSLELGSIWKALAETYTMHTFAPFWNPQSKIGEKITLPK